MDDQMIRHTFTFRTLNRNFSVILSIDHYTVDPVYGAISRNNSEFKIYLTKLVW